MVTNANLCTDPIFYFVFADKYVIKKSKIVTETGKNSTHGWAIDKISLIFWIIFEFSSFDSRTKLN